VITTKAKTQTDSASPLQRWIDQYRDDPEYQLEELLLEVLEQIAALMEKGNLSYSDLADRIGVDKARVARIMRGPRDLAVRDLVEIANALGCRVTVCLDPRP